MNENKVNNPIDTDPDPSPKPGARKLRLYWTRGPGAAKIKWGAPGDFNRCVRHLAKYVSDPKGLCNVYHRSAIGAPPGQGHGKSLKDDLELKKDLEKLGKSGHAFRNHSGEWSYPIANVNDLKNAIRAFGRSAPEDRERLRRYIEKRARELGKPELIPDNWHKKSIEDDLALIEVLSYAETLINGSVSDIIKLDVYDEKEIKDDMQNLDHKNLSVSGGFVEPPTDDGIVEALVSVTGIVDNVNDIIVPGAYEKTLKDRTAKGVWSHDWNTPVSKVLDIEEWMPGDPRLPATLANGEKWPAEAGALYVKAQFNLNTNRGREAYEDVKFFADQCEWSIGYKVPKGKAIKDEKSGIRHIQALDLFEFSPVLFGAASNARSLVSAAKSLFDTEEEFMQEVKSLLQDEEKGDPSVEPDATIENEIVVEVANNHVHELSIDEAHEPENIPAEQELTVPAEKAAATEARANDLEIPLTAQSLAEIKALYDQLGAVLALIDESKVAEKPVYEFGEAKTIDEALALVKSTTDGTEIETSVYALNDAIKAADATEIKNCANAALDDITSALQDEATDEATASNLKTLVAAIGEAVKALPVEEIEEKVAPEVKTITLSQADLNKLFDF